jgi:hypothetical protein
MINKYLLLAGLIFTLAACAKPQPEPEIATQVEVRTVQVRPPAPIIPSVDQVRMRPVNWIILTPENVEEKFAQIRNGELVLFAVTTAGYENIAMNLSDIRALLEQQKRIIAIYESSYR